MNIDNLPLENYRFERKFLIDGLSLSFMETMIKTHPAFFRELFPPRNNNNIYYDTPGMDYYHHNVQGDAGRLKVRVRWYGDLWGYHEKPQLEFKVKAGLVGRKPTFKLPGFTLTPDTTNNEIRNLLNEPSLPEGIRLELLELAPALINRYERQYYMSADGNYRLTLDYNLEFYQVPQLKGEVSRRVFLDNRFILEIKFSQENEKDLERITNHFPFRMTKSSKYVDGVDLLASAAVY